MSADIGLGVQRTNRCNWSLPLKNSWEILCWSLRWWNCNARAYT